MSKNATSASSVSSSTMRGIDLDAGRKKAIWDFLLDTMNDIQAAENAKERKKIFQGLRIKFYEESNPQVVNEYQKYFAQSLWRISVVNFQQASSNISDRVKKFLFECFTMLGTTEDKQEMKFKPKTYPMFFYILKLFNQSHMDKRHLVRLRVMEAANLILEKHAEEPLLHEHHSILSATLDSLSTRIRDKSTPVRALSVTMLRYFAEDKSVFKDLKYYARADPSHEVRKAAITALQDNPMAKVSFFYEHAFDPNEGVRLEAFSILATKSMLKLPCEAREKVLYWGITQEARVKRCVLEKLLPAWFQQCQNNPINFLKVLDVSGKPKVAYVILDQLYPNDFDDTFNSIDRSFLNEEKLIPVDKISLEAVIFWVYIIQKFGKGRRNTDLLLPSANAVAKYIRDIIEAIHAEHRKAQEEDRDEDVSLLICLEYILAIAVHLCLEEGSRRDLESTLKEILLDPLLDEAPLIKTAVDLMKKIVEPKLFVEKMMAIFQELFEPTDPTIIESTPRRSILAQNSQRQAEEAMDVDTTLTEQGSPIAPRPLTDQEITQLKDKVCELAMQRIRLCEQKENALRTSNYLEAHRLQEIIDNISKEEKEIRCKIATPHASFAEGSRPRPASVPPIVPSSTPREARTKSLNVAEVNIEGSRVRVSTAAAGRSLSTSYDDKTPMPMSQATTVGDQLVISEENMLKGLVMVTRFLTISRKMTPFVRELYANHIVLCLTEQDPRIRMHILHLLAIIGAIDPDEKQKVMRILLQALEFDTDPMVKSMAFKGAVDLLVKYKIEEFKCTDNLHEAFEGPPGALYNPQASVAELERTFIIALDKYGDERYGVKTLEAISEKVMGMIKLLQTSRIFSENVVSELLSMWSDNQYRGSAVPYNIGLWLPAFTKFGIKNAKLVSQALLSSVKRIINSQDDKDNSLCGSDYMKLVDFVIPVISPQHFKDEEGTDKVHQELVLMIFEDILKNPKWSGNSLLLKITPKLQLKDDICAARIADVISQILFKIATYPQTFTISSLKIALRNALKRLKKQFVNLEDIDDPDKRMTDAEAENSDGSSDAILS